jgi:negative regulator of flagellin synthesis FlgM
MKVLGDNPSINLDTYLRNSKNDEKVKKSLENDGKAARNEDAVTLSPRAKEIQEAKRLLDSLPDIREEKIAEIKKRIDNGDYEIHEKKIARKMIKESLLNELLDK